jgi:hypothetical protein
MVAIKGGTWAMIKPWDDDIRQASLHLRSALEKVKIHTEERGLYLADILIDVPVYPVSEIGKKGKEFWIDSIVFEPQIIL